MIVVFRDISVSVEIMQKTSVDISLQMEKNGFLNLVRTIVKYRIPNIDIVFVQKCINIIIINGANGRIGVQVTFPPMTTDRLKAELSTDIEKNNHSRRASSDARYFSHKLNEGYTLRYSLLSHIITG